MKLPMMYVGRQDNYVTATRSDVKIVFTDRISFIGPSMQTYESGEDTKVKREGFGTGRMDRWWFCLYIS